MAETSARVSSQKITNGVFLITTIMKTVFGGLFAAALGMAAAQEQSSDWMVGPFARPNNAEPVIRPNPASVFDCPMRKMPVHWEATHTYGSTGRQI